MTSKWSRLQEVYDDVADDPAWKELRQPGIHLVRGDGVGSAETAAVMVVGEAPGAKENGAERPFVGPSGVMLSRLLETIGLNRTDVFVTNVVKYRPPGNRTPTPEEVRAARPALRREWQILQPTLTIALGGTATLALGLPRGKPQAHGVLHPFGGKSATPMFHPAYGLRSRMARIWIEEEWAALDAALKASRILTGGGK
jgi:uracil-DNA glycosylase family 4